MPTNVNKISSNVTGLRIAEEASIKVLPVTPVWDPYEPNSYSDFGGNLTLLARNPITAGRQRKKGVITDLDSAGGFQTDITQTNLQKLLQGFFFASLREKVNSSAVAITSVDATAGNHFNAASGLSSFQVGARVRTTGFSNPANNGIFTVTAKTATVLTVSETVVAEASPPAAARITTIGVVVAPAAIDVVVSGTWPTLTSGSFDFLSLGVVPGEWVYIGGDAAGTKFVGATSGVLVNNGFKRVKSVTTGVLTFDKSDYDMVAETGTGIGLHIYVPARILKNENGSESSYPIVRRTYQMERLLGAPDTGSPSSIQSEYIVGAVPNQFTMNVSPADKITCDLSYMAMDFEQRTAATGVKTGTRPALVDADAFNTSTDFSRIKLSLITSGEEAPTRLFAFVTDLKVTIDNGVSLDKAVGVLGGFDASEGDFSVGGSLTAYFADVTAVSAVRNNSDVTLDFVVVKNNAGIVVDLPLIALGDGRLSIEKDKSITLPLTLAAASAAKIDSATDYTAMMCFFDYLPSAADV